MEKWNLPNKWVWTELKEVGYIFSGSPAPQGKKYFEGGKYPFVRVQDLGREKRTINLVRTSEYINDRAVDELHLVKAKPNTILFPKSGAAILTNNRARLGICAYIVSHLAAVQPKEETWDPKWLYYWLSSVDLKEYINNPTYPSLSLSTIRSIPIPKPGDLNEQRRIVARVEALLHEVREMHELNQKILSDFGHLLDSLLANLFSQDARESWAYEDPLGDLVEISAPLVDPTLPQYRNLPHINGERIEEGTARLLPYNTAADDGMTSSKYYFQSGVILYSKIRPYLRKATLVDFPGLCSADMYPLQLKTDKVVPEYIMWSLLSEHFTEYAKRLSGRARMPKLNRTQLFNYQLRYPEKIEQNRISTLLSQVRDEVSTALESSTKEISLMNDLDQSILTEAFQGKM